MVRYCRVCCEVACCWIEAVVLAETEILRYAAGSCVLPGTMPALKGQQSLAQGQASSRRPWVTITKVMQRPEGA